jgi:hypothetical protein
VSSSNQICLDILQRLASGQRILEGIYLIAQEVKGLCQIPPILAPERVRPDWHAADRTALFIKISND